MKNQSRLGLILVATCALSYLLLTVLYLIYWDLHYDSDTALIGLMGKSILERGDRPIFVWSVGYQGILLEAYSIAAAFKIFGTHPMWSNLPAVFFCGIFFWVFYWANKKYLGKNIALISTLLMIVSAPLFYKMAMRTLGNQVETFIYGFILFGAYHKIMTLILDTKDLRKNWKPVALFGFFVGWGFYSYGLIIYYLAAIGLHLTLYYFLLLYKKQKKNFWKTVVWPFARTKNPKLNRFFNGLNGFLWVHLVFGLITLLLGITRTEIFGSPIKWEPVSMVKLSVVAFTLMNGVNYLLSIKNNKKVVKTWATLGKLTLPFLILGYLPAIYHKIFVGTPSVSRMNLGGEPWQLLYRTKLLLKGQMQYLSVWTDDYDSALDGMLMVLFLVFAGIFISKSFNLIKKSITSQNKKDLLKIHPALFFPVIVIPAFVLAKSVENETFIRFSLPILFFWVIATASFLAPPIFKWNFKKRATEFALVVLIIILGNNAHGFYQDFQREGESVRLNKLVKKLDQEGIKYAYGDFWYAYSISFLTQERIIIEPVYSNYNPHYLPIVRKQKKVAYIDKRPNTVQPAGNRLNIHGTLYRKTRTIKYGELDIHLLARQ